MELIVTEYTGNEDVISFQEGEQICLYEQNIQDFKDNEAQWLSEYYEITYNVTDEPPDNTAMLLLLMPPPPIKYPTTE